jgi:aspartyl protease family protein
MLTLFGLDGDRTAEMVYLVALLVLVAGGLSAYRNRWPKAIRHAGIWLLVFLGILTLYAYRGPIERFAAPVLAVLDPSRVVEVVEGDGRRTLQVARAADGHFRVEARVNGVPVEFMIDTGATGTALTTRDAERAGIAVEELRYDRPVQTANGVAFEARVRLDTVEIGPYRLRDVGAGILPPGRLNTNLLGLNVLDRFATWRMQDDRLILEPAG